MLVSVASLLLGASLVAAQAADFTDLVGTWSSKSNSTLTGPGFYDPVDDRFTEPKHTGISYSFSADGFFEEAYYRAVASPERPDCPKGIIQWQHGKFTKSADGSLKLDPIKVDGRQLYSDPCTYSNSVYTRYNATEKFKRYEVATDGYRKLKRLTLFKADGAPLMPMYLAFTPPQMLPTSTLNPLTTASADDKKSNKVKRSKGLAGINILSKRTPQQQQADQWWWFGLFLTFSGGALYYIF